MSTMGGENNRSVPVSRLRGGAIIESGTHMCVRVHSGTDNTQYTYTLRIHTAKITQHYHSESKARRHIDTQTRTPTNAHTPLGAAKTAACMGFSTAAAPTRPTPAQIVHSPRSSTRTRLRRRLPFWLSWIFRSFSKADLRNPNISGIFVSTSIFHTWCLQLYPIRNYQVATICRFPQFLGLFGERALQK